MQNPINIFCRIDEKCSILYYSCSCKCCLSRTNMNICRSFHIYDIFKIFGSTRKLPTLAYVTTYLHNSTKLIPFPPPKWFAPNKKFMLHCVEIRCLHKTNTIVFTILSGLRQAKFHFSNTSIAKVILFGLVIYCLLIPNRGKVVVCSRSLIPGFFQLRQVQRSVKHVL